MTTKFTSLEKRVERLENILIELAFYPNRCKYIYISELKKLLLNKRLVKEKKTIVKLSEGKAKRVSIAELCKVKARVTKKRRGNKI